MESATPDDADRWQLRLAQLDALAERGIDYAVTLEVGTECAWTCEVRVVDQPNVRERPDRGHVSYNTGAASPESAFDPAAADAIAWLAERPEGPRLPRWNDPPDEV